MLFRGRLRAAQHVKKDDWADYTPTLLLTLSPFFQYPPTTTLPQWGFQAQLLLSWTIYDGGLRYGLGKERAALVREAEANVEGDVRQAQSDVRAADEEVRRSSGGAGRRRAMRPSWPPKGLALTNLAYRAGASTNIEVIDAERVGARRGHGGGAWPRTRGARRRSTCSSPAAASRPVNLFFFRGKELARV